MYVAKTRTRLTSHWTGDTVDILGPVPMAFSCPFLTTSSPPITIPSLSHSYSCHFLTPTVSLPHHPDFDSDIPKIFSDFFFFLFIYIIFILYIYILYLSFILFYLFTFYSIIYL